MNVAWLMHPKAIWNPIGIVFLGLASDSVIKDYEKMKNKFLIKAGTGRFGGGRLDLKKQVAKDIIDECYDDFNSCIFKRQQMLIVEEINGGRVNEDEEKDVYELIVRKCPELERRARRKIQVSSKPQKKKRRKKKRRKK